MHMHDQQSWMCFVTQNCNTKAVPFSGTDRTLIVPLCSIMTCLHKLNPIPLPFFLVLKKGTKILFTNSYKVAEVRFNAGLTTTVEYLAAKNNLDKARSNFVTARYDYFLRSKILDYYQGKRLW